MKYDLIAVGDSTIDAFVPLLLAETKTKIQGQKKTQMLCMEYGTKIPIERITNLPAGNAHNVAVGAGRLGLKVAFHSVVGNDLNGHIIRENLKTNKVKTKFLQTDPKLKTNYHVVLEWKGERSILIFHEPYQYQAKKYKTKWLYFSSVGASGVVKVGEQIIRYLDANPSVKLAFNPGTFQMALGKQKLAPLFNRCEILFVNREEAQKILDFSTKSNKKLLDALKDLGPNIVVMTDGPKGSYCYDGVKYWYAGIVDTPVVDRTGCGDCYAMTFVAARQKGRDVAEAMRWGTINASYKIGALGPQTALLKRGEFRKRLKQWKEFHASEYTRG